MEGALPSVVGGMLATTGAAMAVHRMMPRASHHAEKTEPSG
jgi:hypothetical protein